MPFRHHEAKIDYLATSPDSSEIPQFMKFIIQCQERIKSSHFSTIEKQTAHRLATILAEGASNCLSARQAEAYATATEHDYFESSTSIVKIENYQSQETGKIRRVEPKTWVNSLAYIVSSVCECDAYAVDMYTHTLWIYFGLATRTSAAAEMFVNLHEVVQDGASAQDSGKVEDYYLGIVAEWLEVLSKGPQEVLDTVSTFDVEELTEDVTGEEPKHQSNEPSAAQLSMFGLNGITNSLNQMKSWFVQRGPATDPISEITMDRSQVEDSLATQCDYDANSHEKRRHEEENTNNDELTFAANINSQTTQPTQTSTMEYKFRLMTIFRHERERELPINVFNLFDDELSKHLPHPERKFRTCKIMNMDAFKLGRKDAEKVHLWSWGKKIG